MSASANAVTVIFKVDRTSITDTIAGEHSSQQSAVGQTSTNVECHEQLAQCACIGAYLPVPASVSNQSSNSNHHNWQLQCVLPAATTLSVALQQSSRL